MKKNATFAKLMLIGLGWTYHAQSLSSVQLEPFKMPANPNIVAFKPVPPSLKSESYILIDANSHKILVENKSDDRKEPASLTKMLTLYIASKAIKEGQLRLEDTTTVSENAWKTDGTRMFLKVGQTVSIKDLIYGVIVQSGNDACIALVEHMAGSIDSFVGEMNKVAQDLGMKNSHFSDPTGLPDPNQFSTAKDMALLTQALIRDFPEQYTWYKEKWFTFNDIKQSNRNRLLWNLPYVDGVKTGHHSSGGYILSASGEQHGMRLISVTMQAPTDEARITDSKHLLEFGFRFFETKLLYKHTQVLGTAPVTHGSASKIELGLSKDLHVTYPKGKYADLSANLLINKSIKAPIEQGAALGTLQIKIGDEIIQTQPLIALKSVPAGNFAQRLWDTIKLSLFGKGK